MGMDTATPPSRISILSERVEKGLDLWTGQPLVGGDADNWCRIQDQVEEQEPSLTEAEIIELQAASKWFAEVRFFSEI